MVENTNKIEAEKTSQRNAKMTPQESYDDLLEGINHINASNHLYEILKCFSSQRSLRGNLRKDI